jgi:aminoglycoside/choline kinase family phosphotransferase
MQLSEDDKVLRRIAERRVAVRYKNNATLLGDAIRLFRYLRKTVSLRNTPGLAELLDWLADMGLKKTGCGQPFKRHP